MGKIIGSVLLVIALALTACGDFHGPWEYYPEEREVYTGIFTYGYILSDGGTDICFSKIYELDETSSQNFAFYDSARVTVQGPFDIDGDETDTTLVLSPKAGKPNCFYSELDGITGKSYKMDAYFEWDSAGHAAKSRRYPEVVSISHYIMPGRPFQGNKGQNRT